MTETSRPSKPPGRSAPPAVTSAVAPAPLAATPMAKTRLRFGLLMATAVSVLAVAAAMMAVFGSPTAAQDGDQGAGGDAPSVVTGVDASEAEVEISVLRDDLSIDASELTVVENGQPVDDPTVTTARTLARTTEVVYVLDVDNRTMAAGALNAMATAILASVEDLPADVRVGLVTAGERADLKTRLTTDRTRLDADLRALTAGRGAALHDAVGVAARSFSDNSKAVRTVVVLSSGPDTASERSILAVESELVQAGAQVVWVARGAGDEGLSLLVDRTGGATLTLASMDDVATTIDGATTIASDRLVVSYPATSEVGERPEVVLDLAGQTLRFSYPAGVATATRLQLEPGPTNIVTDLGFFGRPFVLYASVVLAFIAIATGLWALGSMFAGGETSLDKVLARYSERDETLDEEEVQEMLVQTALVRRAIDMTETFAESRGFLTRIEDLLERANLPVRAGEALFFLAAIVLVGSGMLFAVTGSLLVGLVFGVILAIGGFAAVQFIAGRRLKHFEAQLPDALQLLAGTLRAGYSLPQGIDAVSNEIADPMGYELRRAMTEAQLGRELEDALAGIAERLDSEDFAWAVMAIGIQREVGGNLSEVLMTVSDTMIQRERLHREVNALTAEGRVSAGILSMLPPGLGLVMWVMNPDYLSVLFSRTIGWILLGAAVVAGLVGLAWMKKVITIDV
ncbi:MAG: type II secretion system F family protein [Acidimicrobiales bacterium]